MRIFSAAGEEVAVLDAGEFAAMASERGASVGGLKRHLARYWERRYSRFQLRILREGGREELQDDESITAAEDLQLIFLKHLAPDDEREKRFLEACWNGQVDEVERSLEALQDPNVFNEAFFPHTPWELAVFRGHLEIICFLLEAGADKEWADHHQRRPFHWAALAGHVAMVRLLLDLRAEIEAGDMDGQRPLHQAAAQGHLEVAQLLVAHGAEIESEDLAGSRPLHEAAMQGHTDVVRLLLNAGADDYNLKYPLLQGR